MKKAQGLPITTIIIAALALVVFVIMFAIFTGRITIFGRGITECGGICVLPYSETGTQAVTESRTSLDITAACPNPSTQRALTGIYISAGQPANAPANQLIYCSKCCVSIV